MARVEFSEAAAGDVERLIVTHSLPSNTKERIRRSVKTLERFPRTGVQLEGHGLEGVRFILGPWRWMVIVYEYDGDENRVVIVAVEDGRSSTAVTASR